MTRRLRPEETRLWSVVTATVRPAPGRFSASMPPELVDEDRKSSPMILSAAALVPKARPKGKPQPAPDDIEPRRKRHIIRGHDPLEARLDLHGLDQERARVALANFLRRAHDDGYRAALVITGRGVQGDGILRRRTPEWLSEADLRHIVAGFSHAHQRHGGDGAFYVALKRKAGI